MNLGQFGDARYFHKYVSTCYWYKTPYRNECRWAKLIRFYKIESNSAVAAVGLRFWFSPRSGRGTLQRLLTPPLYISKKSSKNKFTRGYINTGGYKKFTYFFKNILIFSFFIQILCLSLYHN